MKKLILFTIILISCGGGFDKVQVREGEKGATGEGDTGSKGDKGDRGDKGDKGDKGDPIKFADISVCHYENQIYKKVTIPVDSFFKDGYLLAVIDHVDFVCRKQEVKILHQTNNTNPCQC